MTMYKEAAEAARMETPHYLAMTMVRDVLKNTGITATAGIGTNLYLAKVAMDIVAKKAPPDKDGVRIRFLFPAGREQNYPGFIEYGNTPSRFGTVPGFEGVLPLSHHKCHVSPTFGPVAG